MTTTDSAMMEERNQKGDSDGASKNLGSFVKINSISIDLADDSNKNHSSGKCDHFSIRGYVSEVRRKNWKLCWPFALDDEKNQVKEDQTSLLPPLTSPKFRWWSCQSCQHEIDREGAKIGHGTRSKDCGTVSKSKSDCPQIPSAGNEVMRLLDVHQASKTNLVEKIQSDVNTSTRVNTKHQDKKAVADSEASTSLTGPENGSGNDGRIKLPRPLDINLNVIEDKPEYDTVTEYRKLEEIRPPVKHSRGKQNVTDVDLATPMGTCKHSAKIHIAADQNPNSAETQLNKLNGDSGSSVVAGSNDGAAGSVKRSTSGHVSGLLDERDNPSSDSVEIVRSNLRDHNHSSSSGPVRRKTRKVRLLTDLLFDNGNAKTDKVIGKDVSPSSAVHSASTGPVIVSVSQSQVSLPDNRGVDLDDSKRKLPQPQDEELRTPEMRSAINLNKKAKSFKESEGTTTVTADSGGPSTGLYVQSGNRTHWSKYGSDNNLVTDKKKKKKIQTTDLRPYLVPIEDHFPIKGLDQVGISSKGHVQDGGVSFRAVKEASSGRGIEKIPLAVPRKEKKPSFSKSKGKIPQGIDDVQPSRYPLNSSGLLKKVPITRNEEMFQTGTTTLSFRQVEDGSIDTGLQLSLGGSAAPKKCSRKYTPEVGDGVSQLYWRESTPVDETMMNRVERNYISESTLASKSGSYGFFKKRVHGDASSQLITYSAPVVNDKQNSNSHSEERRRSLGKQVDNSGSRTSQKTIKAKEHSAVSRKRVLEIADRVPDKGTLDDIPMDIVELMARNQYERGQHNPENNRSLSKASASEGRNSPMLDYDRVYSTKKLRISEETANKQPNTQARSARNGTTSRKNVKPTKQKSVDYYPNVNGDHSNRSQLVPKKSSGVVQLGSGGPTECSCAQNCHWNANILGRSLFNSGSQRGSCDTCPTPPRPIEESTQIWASAVPLERSARYNPPPPQNCAPQRANLQMVSSSHSLPPKVDFINREHDLKFSKHGAANLEMPGQHLGSEPFGRRNSEYPYGGSRHNGVEQNLRGSLDLYSNETIPAMHLLSLMTAGMPTSSPGTSFNTSGNPRLLERDCLLDSARSKNYPPIQIGAYNKPRETAKHQLDYHGKSQLPVKPHNFFPVSPMAGPLSSSFRHEKGFERANEFAGQVSFGSRGKEKVHKSSGGLLQSRGRKPLNPAFSGGRYAVTSHNSIPGHDVQKGFLVPSSSVALVPCSSMALPFQSRASEYPTELKLGTPHVAGTSRPPKIQPETLTCSVNRNPADFSYPEAGNEYMISGEDLKVVKQRKRRVLSTAGPSKRQKNAKRTTDKEQA